MTHFNPNSLKIKIPESLSQSEINDLDREINTVNKIHDEYEKYIFEKYKDKIKEMKEQIETLTNTLNHYIKINDTYNIIKIKKELYRANRNYENFMEQFNL
jgi:phage host-nuclease inhibitor protein Gam